MQGGVCHKLVPTNFNNEGSVLVDTAAWRYKMISKKTIAIISTLFLLTVTVAVPLTILFIPGVHGYDETKTLEKGEHAKYTLSGDVDDIFIIDFSIQSNAQADVYIMTKEDYDVNYPNGNFSTSFEEERTYSFFHSEWKRPDDDAYYLVVDNLNNSRSSDENATGNITYGLTYYNETEAEEFFEDLFGFGMMIVVGCCAITIIIIIVVIWLIVRKKKTDTVVIQGPAGYPPGAPPQYPYQQPPQYQQQQPPQYQQQQPPQYQQQQPPQYQQQPPQNQQQQYQQQQPPQNQQPQYQPQKPPENQQKPPQY